MQREVLIDIDHTALAKVASADSYARGLEYLRQNAVERALWNQSAAALIGTVRGQHRDSYTTTARFALDGGVYRFERGECSCPMRVNCKHVVALVLSLAGPPPAGKGTGGTAGPKPWERSLGALLQSGHAGLAAACAKVPLAVELTLSAAHPPRSRSAAPRTPSRLFARLVRPGKNGWVPQAA